MNKSDGGSEQVSFFERDSVRKNTDIITDKLDEQAIENIKVLQERRNYEEELLASLRRLNAHSICPGNAPTCENEYAQKKEVVKEEPKEEVHGPDCHCSKCCPNPNPNFFQKHKMGILITVIWIMMIFLGIGWTPTGGVAEAIQNSWVELFVNVFKVGMFAIAGVATYNLAKKGND